jgi:hypothetical protein
LTTTLLGRRGAESLEAAKDRHVTRPGLTMIARASDNLGKVFLRNISLIHFRRSGHAIVEVQKVFSGVRVLVRVDVTIRLHTKVDIHVLHVPTT